MNAKFEEQSSEFHERCEHGILEVDYCDKCSQKRRETEVTCRECRISVLRKNTMYGFCLKCFTNSIEIEEESFW